ncbi:MAG: STAS domain-containing protein [Bacteroidetes bacterium]|nr:STAS domain-containing protein [Bacteroidota bacterium]
MQVKIDTREKFHAISIQEPVLAANMTEDLQQCLSPFLEKDVKNVILILKDTTSVDNAAAECLVKIQQSFYDNSASFVICELTPEVENSLEDSGLLEMMNVTPTESEAWDIVHLEEVEREMLGDSDF